MEHARSWAANLFAGFVALVVVGFALAGVVAAAPIPIVNFSFELPAVVDGDYTGSGHAGGVTGWVASTNSGVFNPTAAQIPQGGGATDGVQVGYSNDGSGLRQDLSAVLTANTLYTLQVDILSRIDCCPNQSSTLQLRTTGGDVLATTTISSSPLPGFNTTQTTTFLALAGDPNLTEILQIALISGGPQSDWDNVRLDATDVTAVPEPTALLLWGTTAAGLATVWRRVRGRSFGRSLA